MTDLAQEVETLKQQVKELQKQLQTPVDWSRNLFLPVAPGCHGQYEGITESECKEREGDYQLVLKQTQDAVEWMQHVNKCWCYRMDVECDKGFDERAKRPDYRVIELRRALATSPPGVPVLLRFIHKDLFFVIKHMLLLSGWKIFLRQNSKDGEHSDLYIAPTWCEFSHDYPIRNAFQYHNPNTPGPQYCNGFFV